MKVDLFGFILVVILLSSIPIVYDSGEFDASTVIISVIDGDTFETNSEGTVRLADVDTPEYYENGYQFDTDLWKNCVLGDL